MSVQDMGRRGLTAQGLARGGAVDRRAILEATALLNAPGPVPAVEMAGKGGEFSFSIPTRVALTGAPMRAFLDDAPVAWNAAHAVRPGQRLTIGSVISGTYGYLTPARPIALSPSLGGVSAHLAAGLGRTLRTGDEVPLGNDAPPDAPPVCLAAADRFHGGMVRVMPGPQTDLFADEVRRRFFATEFRMGSRADRRGAMLIHDGQPFTTTAASGLGSDFIVPGDIQMTGNGVPFVLMAECQTIGGYPRIGTVIETDLAIVAQAAPGTVLRFAPVSLDDADRLFETEAVALERMRAIVQPLRRDPGDIGDLLRYQLIDGVTRGDDLERR